MFRTSLEVTENERKIYTYIQYGVHIELLQRGLHMAVYRVYVCILYTLEWLMDNKIAENLFLSLLPQLLDYTHTEAQAGRIYLNVNL